MFAQAFRFLRAHMVDERNGVAQLHMTYHVGEDFLDMVSGLRAIDETIHFMNMGCGSRLGHALALGVNPYEWYEEKNERIILPQQEYLDNVVWLFQMLRIFRISDAEVLRDYLKRQFHNYFSIIYKGVLNNKFINGVKSKALEYYKNSKWADLFRGISDEFDIDSYYCAWSLRGDNPDNYRNGFYENNYMELNSGNRYSSYAINPQFPGKQEERYFPEGRNALLPLSF